MVFTRIATGAWRAYRFVRSSLVHSTWRIQLTHASRLFRRTVTLPIVIASVVVSSLPVSSAPAFAASTDDDPSLRTAAAIEKIRVSLTTITDGVAFDVSEVLPQVQVGESIAEAQAREARQAQEAAAKVPSVLVARKESKSKPASRDCGKKEYGAYDTLFQKYFGDNWEDARRVAFAESGMNTCSISRTNDHGLMQINWRWQRSRVVAMGGTLESLYDPEFNIRVAHAIYAQQGWCPWYAARKIGVATSCR